MAAIIIPGQSGTYRHLQGRVTGLLVDSGQTGRYRKLWPISPAGFLIPAEKREPSESGGFLIPGQEREPSESGGFLTLGEKP